MDISRTQQRIARAAAVVTLLLAAAPAVAARKKDPLPGGPYPPRLPDGKSVLTFEEGGVTVDFLYYPKQNYRGSPWSNWGDGLAVGEKYYSAIGDHAAPQGNAFVYEYDATTRSLRVVVDLQSVLKMPEGHYAPGKIHSRIDLGSDGWLYFSTHRGSTRVTTDQFHYKGDWILRYHPKRETTEIVAHGPAGKQCLPSSVLDPDRLIFYGGTQPGEISDKRNFFFAYDCKKRKLLYKGDGGPSRAMIFARSSGRVYFVPGLEGPLHRYDPARPDRPPVKLDGPPVGIRAATQETPDGYVYFVSKGDAVISRLNVKTETVERIGVAPVGTQTYITTLDSDPTGRFLYYCPGAHGGSERDGTPVVRFDTKTGEKKVIVRLHPAIQRRCGFVPIGTFGSAVSPKGDKLYCTWNGSIQPIRRGRHGFDLCAMTVIHLPAPPE